MDEVRNHVVKNFESRVKWCSESTCIILLWCPSMPVVKVCASVVISKK